MQPIWVSLNVYSVGFLKRIQQQMESTAQIAACGLIFTMFTIVRSAGRLLTAVALIQDALKTATSSEFARRVV